ncbi:MAG: glycosyltransferase family 2 protein [Desulfobulbus sp.]|jgi:GT2 family glycosyltransferase|nr:glycosyltransferase family 2 protein [Desulfobulbus sp.]
MARIAVIIVTHNAEPFLDRCLAGLRRQEEETHLVLVDAGSASTAYLEGLDALPGIRVIRTKNIGFSAANNLGYRSIPEEIGNVVFLNPDAFLEPGTFARARATLAEHPQVGCLTGQLLGWDLQVGRPNGRIDSAGVFRSWYGRWYDRGQGEQSYGQYDRAEEVPAACGAFLFCRRAALDETALAGRAIFAPEFFLYKEDIELSLRLRKAGWGILYDPSLTVYHCRGWDRERTRMPRELRLMASANEVRLYQRHPSPYILWALAKYLLVRWAKV